ncbi:hypothetical protein [Lachnoclostridium sp. Marseille-P6806]|uniref:hypothetical protein n=1 Tax=Lachnoclostridium sp. Marseille-P6806 TaxID=2364793 RepID=UPI00102FF50C|nr:hypothetical protein [Lachnoclostridium sp. Marseille-P6806]
MYHILYASAQAFAFAEFMASVSWFLNVFWLCPEAPRSLPAAICAAVCYAAILLAFFLVSGSGSLNGDYGKIPAPSLIAAAAIVFSSYVASGLGITSGQNMARPVAEAMFGIRALTDFAGVCMLYAVRPQPPAVQR